MKTKSVSYLALVGLGLAQVKGIINEEFPISHPVWHPISTRTPCPQVPIRSAAPPWSQGQLLRENSCKPRLSLRKVMSLAVQYGD